MQKLILIILTTTITAFADLDFPAPTPNPSPESIEEETEGHSPAEEMGEHYANCFGILTIISNQFVLRTDKPFHHEIDWNDKNNKPTIVTTSKIQIFHSEEQGLN